MNIFNPCRPIFRDGLHNILLIVAAIFVGYSTYCFVHFFSLEVRGVIIGRDKDCNETLGNRCDNFLLLQDGDKKAFRFLPVAGFFDFDLLGIGGRLEKKKYSYYYEIDGRTFYFKFYGYFIIVFLFGWMLIIIWLSPMVRRFMDKSLNFKIR